MPPCQLYIIEQNLKNNLVKDGKHLCLFPPMQQQLNTSFDDETAALLNDCYTLEEKERLKEEWRLFEEQKRNFERERKNFTEAAIRLGREVATQVF